MKKILIAVFLFIQNLWAGDAQISVQQKKDPMTTTIEEGFEYHITKAFEN